MDTGGKPITHHQQRRVSQGQAVAQELLERSIKIAARGFVFPGKTVTVEHIGIAARLAQYQSVLLKHVITNATRQRNSEQLTQVNEMGLRPLALVLVIRGATGPPFRDEFLGSHRSTATEIGSRAVLTDGTKVMPSCPMKPCCCPVKLPRCCRFRHAAQQHQRHNHHQRQHQHTQHPQGPQQRRNPTQD